MLSWGREGSGSVSSYEAQITFTLGRVIQYTKSPERYIVILLTYTSVYVNFKTISQIISFYLHSIPMSINASGVILGT